MIIQGTAVVNPYIKASPFSPKGQPKKIATNRKESDHEEIGLQAEENTHEEPQEDRLNANHVAQRFQMAHRHDLKRVDSRNTHGGAMSMTVKVSSL